MLNENFSEEYANLNGFIQRAHKVLRQIPEDRRDEYYRRIDDAYSNSAQPVMVRLNNLELLMEEMKRLIPAADSVVVVRPTRKPSRPNGRPLKLGGMNRPYDANWRLK